MSRTARARVEGLALVFALSVVGACQDGGGGTPCATPGAYPVCAPDGAVLLTCRDGVEVESACAAGEVCLDLGDEDGGVRFSACVPADSTACDPQRFVPSCPDEDSELACLAPATAPTVGHTERLPCAAGESCRVEDGRGACQPPLPPDACDGATFEGACQDALTPVACLDDRLVALPPCAAPLVCVIGPDGAVCAPEPTCDPRDFEPRCVDDETQILCDALGQEVTRTCLEWEACRTGPYGGFCIADGAEPCDPATYAPRCSGASIQVCHPLTGYTTGQGCGMWRRCVYDEGAGGPVCQSYSNY